MRREHFLKVSVFFLILILGLTIATPTARALTLRNVQAWYWGQSARATSVATQGDVDSDGKSEVVTGGIYNDGVHWVAQLCVWDGTTLAPKNVRTWYWGSGNGSSTVIESIAIGDVNGDGKKEIVTGGWYYDANTAKEAAQLCVWDGATLMLDNVKTWDWGNPTTTRINSVAIGDVDVDGKREIVTGGFYSDLTHNVAQLCVWDGATLTLKNVRTWYWTSNDGVQITSIAVGDVNGDGKTEIVTGGFYFDGTRANAQLCVWSGATLALENVKTWYWTSTTQIWSVAVGDIDGDSKIEIDTGGWYFDGTRYVAQLCVWDGATLSLKNVRTWYWTSETNVKSIVVRDVDRDGTNETVSGGWYYDGTRYVAQLCIWHVNSSALITERIQTWYWTSDTKIYSVTAGDLYGVGDTDIVTGGSYFSGIAETAQLCVWRGY